MYQQSSWFDDALFFGEWSIDNASNLIRILNYFGDASGLKINMSKNKVYGINVSDDETANLANILSCTPSSLPFKYLGMPVGDHMSSIIVWADVVNWDQTRASKNGGLGIGSLKAKNLSLLCKWWWRFRHEPNALWCKVIRSLYGDDGGLFNVQTLANLSPLWKQIRRCGFTLDDLGITFSNSIKNQVGNGSETSFWHDLWLPESNQELKYKYHRLYTLEAEKS
ncbi:uncharacterized protein [Rutidosis leptorrhynchoides]|uniref:uncharacterized protein n=1 Tax=Rutidosis leptorrhynchoides TaxID=125765 RepID=UPI003A990A51